MTPEDLRTRTVITVEELGQVFGVGRRQAYDLVHSDQIPIIRVGRSIRVPVAPVLDMLGLSPKATK